MIPEGDEKAVMEAVYSRGPLAISLDASHDSFRFYASGVFVKFMRLTASSCAAGTLHMAWLGCSVVPDSGWTISQP